MRKPIIALALSVLIFNVFPAWAASPSALLNQARASYLSSNYVEAINTLQKTIEAVWEEAPLTVQNATFIQGEVKEFGVYKPRGSNVFDGVEPVQIYCEPIGCILKKVGRGYSISLSQDFAVMDAGGQNIGGMKDQKVLDLKLPTFTPQIMLDMTFNLKGIVPGKYTLAITVKDNNSTKTGTFELPFEIR